MRTAVWVAVGWLGVTLGTALAVRLGPAHVFADISVVVLVFLALHREPIPLALAAIALGYLVGLQSAAPVGVHESAMVVSAIGVYVVAGHLAGSGALFFGAITGAATMGYQATLFLLLYLFRGAAGFSSWATAVLVFDAAITAAVASILYGPMQWLENKMAVKKVEGLQWR